ncbi:hypothetical protein RHMOL_Rhmol05G0053300 [Rhododendron molle]|uniref:Uncharacterized protein n=1 Tax=Rhododendron molle TaxID=49168 RepID=A0ACC0NKL2_RHOML|nr:hypothetical protein RHMOL_Rhmol05G0053300 [Rhododendron molle]
MVCLAYTTSDSKNLIAHIATVKASIRLIIHPLPNDEYELILLLNGRMNMLKNFIAIKFDGTWLALLRFNRLWKAPIGYLERVTPTVIQFFIKVVRDPKVGELTQEGLLSFAKEQMHLVIPQVLRAADDERAIVRAQSGLGGVGTKIIEITKLLNPKPFNQFSDFRWPDSVPEVFPDQNQVLEYLKSYARHFDLLHHIRFNTKVVIIDYEGPSSEVFQPRGKVTNYMDYAAATMWVAVVGLQKFALDISMECSTSNELSIHKPGEGPLLSLPATLLSPVDLIAGLPDKTIPLYRECVHPQIPLLEVIGSLESIANLYTSEIRCRWLAELDGTFELPSIKKIEKDISEWDEYMKRYSDKNYWRSYIGALHIWYNDQLCKDMGYVTWT